MKHPYDILQLTNHAKLIFTPCPGTRDTTLDGAVKSLAEAGATALITAMPMAELATYQVEKLPKVCSAHGIKWIHLPVEDDKSPEQAFTEQLHQHKPELLELINNIATIAIHCKGGSGRTGLIAAVLLLESGQHWQKVKDEIQSLRPRALTLDVHLKFLSKHFAI